MTFLYNNNITQYPLKLNFLNKKEQIITKKY